MRGRWLEAGLGAHQPTPAASAGLNHAVEICKFTRRRAQARTPTRFGRLRCSQGNAEAMGRALIKKSHRLPVCSLEGVWQEGDCGRSAPAMTILTMRTRSARHQRPASCACSHASPAERHKPNLFSVISRATRAAGRLRLSSAMYVFAVGRCALADEAERRLRVRKVGQVLVVHVGSWRERHGIRVACNVRWKVHRRADGALRNRVGCQWKIQESKKLQHPEDAGPRTCWIAVRACWESSLRKSSFFPYTRTQPYISTEALRSEFGTASLAVAA